MKVVPNGGLNVSVLDGWWVEGYKEGAGWMLPMERTFADQHYQDELDAEMIYNTIEEQIAPKYYARDTDGIPHEWGTAVNVQAMVFGNSGDTSGTGVAFTRDPANGEKVHFGEYLMNAQGEDVVAGVRTPKPLAEMANDMPQSYEELKAVFLKLEQHFKDVQDVEFTVEDGKLYMLQTRHGKRTGLAAINIAVDCGGAAPEG